MKNIINNSTFKLPVHQKKAFSGKLTNYTFAEN